MAHTVATMLGVIGLGFEPTTPTLTPEEIPLVLLAIVFLAVQLAQAWKLSRAEWVRLAWGFAVWWVVAWAFNLGLHTAPISLLFLALVLANMVLVFTRIGRHSGRMIFLGATLGYVLCSLFIAGPIVDCCIIYESDGWLGFGGARRSYLAPGYRTPAAVLINAVSLATLMVCCRLAKWRGLLDRREDSQAYAPVAHVT